MESRKAWLMSDCLIMNCPYLNTVHAYSNFIITFDQYRLYLSIFATDVIGTLVVNAHRKILINAFYAYPDHGGHLLPGSG